MHFTHVGQHDLPILDGLVYLHVMWRTGAGCHGIPAAVGPQRVMTRPLPADVCTENYDDDV